MNERADSGGRYQDIQDSRKLTHDNGITATAHEGGGTEWAHGNQAGRAQNRYRASCREYGQTRDRQLLTEIGRLVNDVVRREADDKIEIDRLAKDAAKRETNYKTKIGRLANDAARRETNYKTEIGRLANDAARRETDYKTEIDCLANDAVRREADDKIEIGRIANGDSPGLTDHAGLSVVPGESAPAAEMTVPGLPITLD